MSKKALTIVLVVSIGINLGLLGFMAYKAVDKARFFGGRRPLTHWLGTVEGITPEQQDRIKAIMSEGRAPIETLMDDLFAKRCELTLLIAEPNPDLAAIDAKIAEIAGVQAQMERLIVGQLLAVRTELTPEQRQLLSEYMGKCMVPPHHGPPFDGRKGPDRSRDRGWGRGGPSR